MQMEKITQVEQKLIWYVPVSREIVKDKGRKVSKVAYKIHMKNENLKPDPAHG